MTRREDQDDGVTSLHRMIAYIREEATRLRVTDVALLLARAEDALVTLRPPEPGEASRELARNLTIAEH